MISFAPQSQCSVIKDIFPDSSLWWFLEKSSTGPKARLDILPCHLLFQEVQGGQASQGGQGYRQSPGKQMQIPRTTVTATLKTPVWNTLWVLGLCSSHLLLSHTLRKRRAIPPNPHPSSEVLSSRVCSAPPQWAFQPSPGTEVKGHIHADLSIPRTRKGGACVSLLTSKCSLQIMLIDIPSEGAWESTFTFPHIHIR